MTLRSGSVVDRYLIEGPVGRGALAVVYRARHQDLGLVRALKVMTLSSPGLARRTLQEGRAQAALRHPNVVSVLDVLHIQDRPALVLEYVDGPTLELLLEHRRLTFRQVDALARGVLAGAIAAHRFGLVHRDLKPANILIAFEHDQPVPRIADFGLARVLDTSPDEPRATQAGVMMGTPAYMAPEQFSNARDVDARADVFSLGAVLYEMLTGEMAFPARDATEAYRMVLTGSWRPVRQLVPDAPERMVKAIEGALEPEVEARTPDVEELLRVWIGDATLSAADAPTDEPVWKPADIELMRSLAPRLLDVGSRSVGARAEPTDVFGIHRTEDEQVSAPPPDVGSVGDGPRSPFLHSGPGMGSGTIPSAAPVTTPPGRQRWAVALSALALALTLAVPVGIILLIREPPPDPGQPADEPADRAPAALTPPPEVAPAAPVEQAPEPAVPPRASEPAPKVLTRPEPAPVASAPPEAPVEAAEPAEQPGWNVSVSGVSRAWLVAEDGNRYKPGLVPPGTYSLEVFFDPTRPTSAMSLEVKPGRTYTIRCEAALRICR